jgi:hypothetical protein
VVLVASVHVVSLGGVMSIVGGTFSLLGEALVACDTLFGTSKDFNSLLEVTLHTYKALLLIVVTSKPTHIK